jgi:hypothetical protein
MYGVCMCVRAHLDAFGTARPRLRLRDRARTRALCGVSFWWTGKYMIDSELS